MNPYVTTCGACGHLSSPCRDAVLKTIRPLSMLAWILVAACSGPTSGRDATVTLRDANLPDGGGLVDTGITGDASAPVDAGWSGDGGARYCVDSLCDPRRPDEGCGAAGTCTLDRSGASCQSVVGGLGPEMACTRVGDCAPGLACFRTDTGGTCQRVCCPGDGEACLADQTCGGSGVLVDGVPTTWGSCLPVRECSVLSPREACEDREACYIVVEDSVGHTECRIEGDAGVGAPCTQPEDCRGGLFCGGLPAARRCVRVCRIGQDDCSTGEGSCTATAQSPPGLGLCTGA